MSDNNEQNTPGYLPPEASFWPHRLYPEMHDRSMVNPEAFWAEEAKKLEWDKTWRKSKVAIYWEGENGVTRVLSYSTLYRDINRYASVLQKLGVKKGDKVALYLPMIPELPTFMLACADEARNACESLKKLGENKQE